MKQSNTHVTWNKDWITQFESPWGIFEKFKYANATSVRDILSLFGSDQARQFPNSTCRNIRNLITLDGIDERLISKSLAYPVKKTHFQNVNSLFGVLSIDRFEAEKYFNEHLVYCENCISIGHHSLFHQFLLIPHCPYHKTPLIKECPTCSREIPYILSDEYTDFPFTCKCGRPFFEDQIGKMSFPVWKGARKLRITDSEIKKWLCFNKSSDRICKIYFCQSLNLNPDHIIKNLLEVLIPTSLDTKISNYIVHFTAYKKGINQVLQEDFYTSSYKIYKSIARHLKKSVLKEHITCITRLKRKSIDTEMCPYAYAFVNWRKNLEGLNHYSDAENGTKLKRHKVTRLEFALNQSTITLEALIEDIKVTVPDTTSNQQLIWTVNKIISILILNHFYTWLAISKELASKNLIIHHTPFGYESLPYFFMEFNQKEGRAMKLSYWDPVYKILGQKESNLICPFSTNT